MDVVHDSSSAAHCEDAATLEMDSNCLPSLAGFELRLPPSVVRSQAVPRASCMKRSASAAIHSSSQPVTLDSASTSSSPSSTSSSSTPRVLSPGSFSFAAPRCFSAALPGRSVHFDSSPPQSFDTFSSEDYDRSQIECTRGGSDLDMTMSSKCRRYTENEEEDGELDEEVLSSRSPPLGARGSTGWVCLKNGSLIGSIKSAHKQLASEKATSADPEAVKLPTHGIRAFGGLARKSLSSDSSPGDEDESSVGEYCSDDALDVDLEADEAAKSEAAALAALPTKSPNATPKGSPSIKLRWAHCTGYFEEPPGESLSETPSASIESTLPTNVTTDSSHTVPVQQNLENGVTNISHTHRDTTDTSPNHTPRMETAAMPLPLEDHFAAFKVEDNSATPCATRMDRSSSNSSASSHDSAESHRPASLRSARFGPERVSESSTHSRHSPSTGSESSTWSAATGESASTPLTSSLSSLQGPEALLSHSVSLGFAQASGSSPISSRCSSIDPWSSLSSGDEGTGSPYGDWSSCTSPDMAPFNGHHTHDGLFSLKSPEVDPHSSAELTPHHPANHHHLDAGIQCASADEPHKTVLSNALTALHAAQQALGPCSSGDEETLGLKPPRRKSSGSRSPSGGRRKSSREKSCLSGEALTPTEDEDGSVSPGCDGLHRKKSGSKSGCKISPPLSRRISSRRVADEIEDEGALGGF